jgi:hypothetical protein
MGENEALRPMAFSRMRSQPSFHAPRTPSMGWAVEQGWDSAFDPRLSWDDEDPWLPEDPPCHPSPPQPARSPPRRHNKTPKGYGPESKARSGTQWDDYKFENGMAYSVLRMDYEGITTQDLRRVFQEIQSRAEENGIPLRRPIRMENRRKRCGFHYLDENWGIVSQFYPSALRSVLHDSKGVKARGRPKNTQPASGCPTTLFE